VKIRPSNYSHLWKLCLWVGIVFIPLTLAVVPQQISLLYSPFDLNRLEKDEVLLFDYGSARQLYAMKLKTLANRPPADVLITGNHVMRFYSGREHFKNLDLFNFVIGSPSLFQELDLLKALKKINRLPKKLLVHTILAHGGSEVLLTRSELIYSGGNATPPFNISIKKIEDEILWFFKYETYLNGIYSFFRKNVVVNYPKCAAAFSGAEKVAAGNWLKARIKFAEYLPPYTTLNSGLLSIDEFCRSERNFRLLDTNGLVRNGGQMAKLNSELFYHRVYDFPVATPSEAAAQAKIALSGIAKLEKFADENGFKVIYLIPPRYEIPLNGPNDEVANIIFEKNTELTVIDFRRFSLEKKYYMNEAHPSEEFGKLLAPCLDRIISSAKPLVSRHAVGARGRTVC